LLNRRIAFSNFFIAFSPGFLTSPDKFAKKIKEGNLYFLIKGGEKAFLKLHIER